MELVSSVQAIKPAGSTLVEPYLRNKALLLVKSRVELSWHSAYSSSRENTAYSPSNLGIFSGASHRSHFIDTSWFGKLAIISVSASNIASISASRISPSYTARTLISSSFHRHNTLRTPHPIHPRRATCIPNRTLTRKSIAFIIWPRWNYVNTFFTFVNNPIRSRTPLSCRWININCNFRPEINAFS